MEIKELENKIKELQEEIERLKNKENKRWKAKMEESYFYIDEALIVRKTVDCQPFDSCRYKYHNYFKTEAEAQTVADNIKTHIELMELAEELNTEPVDWENREQRKYYIWYNCATKKVCYGSYYYTKYANIVYCTNENFKDEAIKRIGEERLVGYLKGE